MSDQREEEYTEGPIRTKRGGGGEGQRPQRPKTPSPSIQFNRMPKMWRGVCIICNIALTGIIFAHVGDTIPDFLQGSGSVMAAIFCAAANFLAVNTEWNPTAKN